MTKKILVSIAGALSLAGCASHQFLVPDAERPRVILVGTNLVVNQEPVVAVRRGNDPAVISWRLQPDGKLTFAPGDGIKVLARIKDEKMNRVERDTSQAARIKCQLGEQPPSLKGDQRSADEAKNPRAYTCIVPTDILHGLYEYEINATDGTTTIKADPTMMI